MANYQRAFLHLRDARAGLPNESKAVGTIAMFAVIPATIAGIGLGVLLTDERTSAERLLAVCSATAFGTAALTLIVLKVLHRVVCFRAVTRVAAGLIGAWVGLMLGSALMYCSSLGGWPLLLAPIFAVANMLRPTAQQQSPAIG